MILYFWRYANGAFNNIAVMDYATSTIWVQRFNAAGEFEIYVRASTQLYDLLQGDIFITRPDSEIAMYVEKIDLNTDDENGDYLTISGRSAECIIGRRIIRRTVFVATVTAEYIIRTLMNSNIINPASTQLERKIDFISLAPASGYNDPFKRQFTGKNLLESIADICVMFNYGFKLTWTGSGFVFSLYKGTDRSYGQTENTYVVFSPEFENIGNTTYTHDTTTYYNSVIIGGQGEGENRTITGITTGATGLDLKETWVDARNTSQGDLSLSEYIGVLQDEAKEALGLSKVTTKFSGEILNYNAYVYGKDYFLGDKVSVKNRYGITGNATVTEITEVEDDTGYRLVPTLSEWAV